jgi:hypothetical protein
LEQSLLYVINLLYTRACALLQYSSLIYALAHAHFCNVVPTYGTVSMSMRVKGSSTSGASGCVNSYSRTTVWCSGVYRVTPWMLQSSGYTQNPLGSKEWGGTDMYAQCMHSVCTVYPLQEASLEVIPPGIPPGLTDAL